MIPTWLALLLDAQEAMIEALPPGRARSLALTKLDEARLWALEADRIGAADQSLAEANASEAPVSDDDEALVGAQTLRPVYVVCDAPPEAQAGRFVEVEDEDGKGAPANSLTWEQTGKGLWRLGPFLVPVETDVPA